MLSGWRRASGRDEAAVHERLGFEIGYIAQAFVLLLY